MMKRTQPFPANRFLRTTGARAALALAACLIPTPAAVAEMYRWVDESGVTVYSQRPPPDAPATTIAPPPKPNPAETERAYDRLKDQVTRDFDAKEDQQKQAEAQAKRAEVQATRSNNCAIARKNLQTLEALGARRLLTSDGEYKRISDDERAKRIQTMQKAIEENCD